MFTIKEFFQRLKIAITSYIKGLLLLALLTFVILALGLNIIGIDHAILKALGVAIIDMIPVFGSGAVMIPWAIFTAISGNMHIASYLAILYIAIIVIRFIAEPLIVGKSVGISPLLTIAISIICIVIFGPAGAVIGGFITVPIKVFWELASGKSAISSINKKELP